jgi:AcrR family transcriptional regulator
MAKTARAKRQTPDSRRAAILDAAAQVFFEQGYAATSVDAIISHCGGSKRNIYREFGSKEGLFTTLVSESAESAVKALPVDGGGGQPLREILLDFGRRLLTLYMSPALLGAYRSILTEARRFPDLAKAFYEKGPGRAADRLAEVLEDAKASGDIHCDDCHAAADHFMGMLRDNLHLRVVLGLQPPPSPAEIEAAVASAVEIFLHGVAGSRAIHD